VNSAPGPASHLLLFLDFDGVLHPLAEPTGEGRGRPYTGPTLVYAPVLAELLAPWIERIDIVIASTWAKARSLDEIAVLLPESLGARVIGAVWDASVPPQASRFEAINRWLAHVGYYDRMWIALDDDARGWPEDARCHLVWCRASLIDRSIQTELRARLAGLLEAFDPRHAPPDGKR